MSEKEDLDGYFKSCRDLSRKRRAEKEAKKAKKLMSKKLSRTERMMIRGKRVMHTLDKVSKRAAKFDIDEMHEQEKRLAGKKKKEMDKAPIDFLKGL